MNTPRQTYSEAREQLEREATITISVRMTLPEGTTALAEWPESWKAPTYEDADTESGVDLTTDLWELVSMAMGDLVHQKLGEYPPPTAEDVERLRAQLIAMGIDPDDPDAPFAELCARLRGA